MATATASKPVSASKPTPVPDVTGAKKKGPPKGVSRGQRTTPTFLTSKWTKENREFVGAITKAARAIAARNSGYLNAEMVRREMESHPAFQRLLTGGGDAVIPTPAHKLLTVLKVKELHALGVEKWKSSRPDDGTEWDPYSDGENGPKNGPFAKFARQSGQVEITADEADEL